MRRQSVRAALALAAAFAVSPAASADPIALVTSGHYQLTWNEESSFAFAGSGFSLRGSAATRDMPLFRCQPCAPGTSIDLSATFGADTVFHGGPAIVDSLAYPEVFYSGTMRFAAGSVTAPELQPSPDGGAASAASSLPFSFSALLGAYDNAELTGSPLFAEPMFGHGTGTVLLIDDLEGGVRADRVLYEFENGAPVPEPATRLLLGSGLAAMGAARRRSRPSRTANSGE